MGRNDLYKVDIQKIEVHSGDLLLLCSDGLTEEVSDDLISNYLSASESCEQAAVQLIEAAKTSGGSDNITVIMVTKD